MLRCSMSEEAKVDTVFLLRGRSDVIPSQWKAKAIRCTPEGCRDALQLRSRRKKDFRVMLSVTVKGIGLAMQDASGRVKEETRLRTSVLDTRARLHDLLRHNRLSDTALPVALELQVRLAVLW